jgi:hypothetical protein
MTPFYEQSMMKYYQSTGCRPLSVIGPQIHHLMLIIRAYKRNLLCPSTTYVASLVAIDLAIGSGTEQV